MRKAILNEGDSDTSDDERRKTIREEKKVRTKKKKRKRRLTDLHQNLFKSKKERQTRVNGKLNIPQNLKKSTNRILPSPCAGIYRNGAAGKEIRRVHHPSNDVNNARLEGNVLKLLNGYDPKSEAVVIDDHVTGALRGQFIDSTHKSIVQPTGLITQCTSPVLGKTNGKRRCHDADDASSINIPSRSSESHKESLFPEALSKYEELCEIIKSENFEDEYFTDHFAADPLITVKRKLRSIYAEAFRSQFLRDMIKRGTILKEHETPNIFVDNRCSSEITNCTSEYAHKLPDCHSDNVKHKETEEKKGRAIFLQSALPFNTDAKINEFPPSNFLFDASIVTDSNVKLNSSSEQEYSNVIENTRNKEINNCIPLKGNHRFASACGDSTKDFEDLSTMDNGEKSTFSAQVEKQSKNTLVNKRYLIKYKNQRTQTAHSSNSELKEHVVKQSSKISRQIKLKNLKHVPAILRRCDNPVDHNKKLNLFQTMARVNKEPKKVIFEKPSKQNNLFEPEDIISDFNKNSQRPVSSDTKNSTYHTPNDFHVQTCVIASPSLQNGYVRFVENSPSQETDTKNHPQSSEVKNIFTKKNPLVQKTVMFTRKDFKNIERCLHTNNIITDEALDNPNVCIIKKNISVRQDKSAMDICTGHKKCYKTFHYLQREPNYDTRTLEESQEIRKPRICEKVFLRRTQQTSKSETRQKCDEGVCYVVLDQCKNKSNVQECSSSNMCKVEKSRMLSNRFLYQEDADIGILKGVQNLKILPVEKKRLQTECTNSQCTDEAIVYQEQPIKYLAFDGDLKTHKIPVYVTKKQHVTTVDNVEIPNHNFDCHTASCSQDTAEKIILLPACEQNKVVYVKRENIGHSHDCFEECSHAKKTLLHRSGVQCLKNEPNTCEVHIPKQGVIEIVRNECNATVTNLQSANSLQDNEVNCAQLHYRHGHGHPLLNDACTRNQTIYYRK